MQRREDSLGDSQPLRAGLRATLCLRLHPDNATHLRDNLEDRLYGLESQDLLFGGAQEHGQQAEGIGARPGRPAAGCLLPGAYPYGLFFAQVEI